MCTVCVRDPSDWPKVRPSADGSVSMQPAVSHHLCITMRCLGRLPTGLEPVTFEATTRSHTRSLVTDTKSVSTKIRGYLSSVVWPEIVEVADSALPKAVLRVAARLLHKGPRSYSGNSPPFRAFPAKRYILGVEPRGFEPLTSAVQSQGTIIVDARCGSKMLANRDVYSKNAS